MRLAFILTMPVANSWNGKWSGEGRLYCVVRAVPEEDTARILLKPNYSYRWDDGWVANIKVRAVSESEAEELSEKSVGFNGYEWMVDTIIRYGKPMADHQIAEFLAEQKEPAAVSQ